MCTGCGQLQNAYDSGGGGGGVPRTKDYVMASGGYTGA